jgi:hypothetical protein
LSEKTVKATFSKFASEKKKKVANQASVQLSQSQAVSAHGPAQASSSKRLKSTTTTTTTTSSTSVPSGSAHRSVDDDDDDDEQEEEDRNAGGLHVLMEHKGASTLVDDVIEVKE